MTLEEAYKMVIHDLDSNPKYSGSWAVAEAQDVLETILEEREPGYERSK